MAIADADVDKLLQELEADDFDDIMLRDYKIPKSFSMALAANGFNRKEPTLRVGDARIALRGYDLEKLDSVKKLMNSLYSDESSDIIELDAETLNEASFGKYGDMGPGTVGSWVKQRDSITIVVVCPRGSLLENYFITDVLRDMVDTYQVTVLIYDSQYNRKEKVTNAINSFKLLIEKLLPLQAVTVRGVTDFNMIAKEDDVFDLHVPMNTMLIAFDTGSRCGRDIVPAVKRYNPSLILTMDRGAVKVTVDRVQYDYGKERPLQPRHVKNREALPRKPPQRRQSKGSPRRKSPSPKKNRKKNKKKQKRD